MDELERLLAEAWHSAFHHWRGEWDPCRDVTLDTEPAARLVAALPADARQAMLDGLALRDGPDLGGSDEG